jgi:hypothetical protein
MAKKPLDRGLEDIPTCAAEFVKLVIKKMRYRKKVRSDVQAELATHFEDILKDCATDKEKEQTAQQLIADFGDVKLLAVLLRRAKKRCRPLWKKAIVRSLQAVGVIIVLFCLYAVSFVTGKPTISVDYLALFNQMSRPQIRDEDNAWPHYQKAISLLIESSYDLKELPEFKNANAPTSRSLSTISDDSRELIQTWVQSNEAAWQHFLAGSRKSYCYREYKYDPNDEDKWLFSIVLPNLRTLRHLAWLGIWRSRIDRDQGQTQWALENCLALARVGSHWQGKGTLVEQLVGIAISSLAHSEILYVTQAQKLPADNLKQLQQQLSQLYSQDYPLMDLEGERLAFLDTVQHVFSDGGPGGGHLLPKGLRWLESSDGSPMADSEMMIPFFTAGAMLHARRDETVAKATELYNQLCKTSKMSPYERRVQNIRDEDDMLTDLPYRKYFLIHYMMPAMSRVSEIAYRGKVTHEATLTILALQRWQSDKGQYPAALDELVAAGYLKLLPQDPFSDKPLVYRRADGDFVLYSLGYNFADDGGESAKDRKGRPRMWSDDGDAVFWPLPDSQVEQ